MAQLTAQAYHDDEMYLDESSGSHTGPRPQQQQLLQASEEDSLFALPLPNENNSKFGRLSELPPTKAMKTLCKNLVAKFVRYQARLVEYGAICANDATTLSSE